jgi:hypothetical protein
MIHITTKDKHYCESTLEKCDQQCNFCKNEEIILIDNKILTTKKEWNKLREIVKELSKPLMFDK